MSLSALATAVLLGQSAFSLAVGTPGVSATADTVDAAYSELASGHSQAAIDKLETGAGLQSNDPAKLINLGAAYERLGHRDMARSAYRAAISTSQRYDLEMADGTWLDSRDAARRALEGLATSAKFAAR